MDIPSSWFHLTIVGLLLVVIYLVWPRKSGFMVFNDSGVMTPSQKVLCELNLNGAGVTNRECRDGYPCPQGDVCYMNYYMDKGNCARLS